MALNVSFKDRVDAALRVVVPLGLMVFLLVASVAALSYPLSFFSKIPFFLIGIYYWSIYRPTLVPPWFMFAAGISIDIINALPLGLNALSFVLFRWLITDQRRFLMGQPFLVIWIGFLLLALVFVFVQWGIFSLINSFAIPVGELLFSVILSGTVFPVIYFLFHLTHKILPTPKGRLSLKDSAA